MTRKLTGEQIAYHEAGHAVAAHFLGIPVKAAAITRGHPEHAGFTENYRRPAENSAIECDRRDGWKKAIPRLMVAYAGPIAEEMFTGRRNRVGAQGDDREIADLVFLLTGDDEEGAALVRWVEARTRYFLRQPRHWLAVRRVAAAILEKRSLNRRQVIEACCYLGSVSNWRTMGEVDSEMAATRRHLLAIERRRRSSKR
jgi:hypothetical protein